LHIPQWARSVRVSAQKRSPPPSAALAQVASPAAQSGAHAPIEHTWPIGHARPQATQFARSVRASTQRPSQRVSVDWQRMMQAPAVQSSPLAQARSQRPQWAGSVRTLTQPSPQKVVPASQRWGASAASGASGTSASRVASGASIGATSSGASSA